MPLVQIVQGMLDNNAVTTANILSGAVTGEKIATSAVLTISALTVTGIVSAYDFVTTIGTAGATGGGTNRLFWENDSTMTTNYTITSGKNAMTAGPITINNGVTLTVLSGSTWTVI